jgi:predicted ester cyclase
VTSDAKCIIQIYYYHSYPERFDTKYWKGLHFEVEEVIVEGDTVVSRWHLTGTQDGPLEGRPASNKEVSVDGVSIDHFKDGRIISGFDAWDALGFRQQLDLDR